MTTTFLSFAGVGPQDALTKKIGLCAHLSWGSLAARRLELRVRSSLYVFDSAGLAPQSMSMDLPISLGKDEEFVNHLVAFFKSPVASKMLAKNPIIGLGVQSTQSNNVIARILQRITGDEGLKPVKGDSYDLNSCTCRYYADRSSGKRLYGIIIQGEDIALLIGTVREILSFWQEVVSQLVSFSTSDSSVPRYSRRPTGAKRKKASKKRTRKIRPVA